MSLIQKLFGRKPQPVVAPTPPPPPPKPDRTAEFQAEEARLTAALNAGAEADLSALVTEGSATRTRQRAAEAIHDPERIRELIRVMRGKDNAVYKILTAKRDALLEIERAAAALRAEQDAVAAAIARHARLPYDPIYEATLREHERRWQAVSAQAAPEQVAAVSADLDTARAVVNAHAAQLQAEAERRAALAAAAAEAAAQAEAQRTDADRYAAESAEAHSAERARHAAERAEQDARAQSESEAVREVVSLLRQVQNALDRGGSARAARLRESLTAKLAAAPELVLPAWFQRQLTQADEQLAKVRDWLAFTVGPKRAELIDRMQSLVGAEIAPEQLALHIRKLQDEWRTLHRGAGEDDPAEEARFKEVANQAYEPCKVHFAAKAAQRAENREKREAILAVLAEFAATLDGEAPQWRRCIPTLVEARRQWRQYAPVDQEIAEALQARFKAALEQISSTLDAEQTRNVAAKRALIERAAGLLTLEDVRQAIDGAKALQREWKTIGIVPREQDNALWEEFRGHCNAVFERSANEAAAFQAALSVAAERATALIAELETIAALEGEPLREALKGLEGLQQEFATLDLPRQQSRDLSQQFYRMIERCHDALQHDRARAVLKAWSDLYDAAAHIRAYGYAEHSGESAEQLETRRTAVQASLAGLNAAPKFARSALDRQWLKVQSGLGSVDTAANEAALRMVCIRAEIAFDLETPAEDQELRREYQMKRLVESTNLGNDAEPVSMDDLALEWFSVGPVAAAVEQALSTRFAACRERASRRR